LISPISHPLLSSGQTQGNDTQGIIADRENDDSDHISHSSNRTIPNFSVVPSVVLNDLGIFEIEIGYQIERQTSISRIPFAFGRVEFDFHLIVVTNKWRVNGFKS